MRVERLRGGDASATGRGYLEPAVCHFLLKVRPLRLRAIIKNYRDKDSYGFI